MGYSINLPIYEISKMSNISNRHNVVPFIAGTSAALTNQRLARVLYKPSKGVQKYPSVCVSIPTINKDDVVSKMDSLIVHMITFLEDVQDSVIKNMYEQNEGKMSSIGDEDISIDACIAYLEMEKSGGRITKEVIGKWFNDVLNDSLMVVIATKLGYVPENAGDGKGEDVNIELTDAQMNTIEKHINAYRELFMNLAGKNVMMQDAQINGMIRAMAYTSMEDEIGKKVMGKLEDLKNKPKIGELLGL